MIEFDTTVSDVIQRTANSKSFRFETGKELDFKAGQYFFVTIEVRGKKETKHFSFSNSPTEKGYIEFTKRITDSPFSKALDELKAGDPAHLRMPYGSFTFEGEYEKIAFLSGGIGITPIRSICAFIRDKKLPTDVILLYGNNKEDAIIFREDLDNLGSSNKNIHVVYTLISQDIDKRTWSGRTGYIDDKAIKEEIPDFEERIFYICGPPKMVEGLNDVLKNKLNIEDNNIKIENFPGY